MRLCTRCILPETFPGITFDNQGVCNHCRREEAAIARAPEKKAEYRTRLDSLIAQASHKAPVYDVIMAYSGGKDSSYTLKLLREHYDLRILALTFDNHFISSLAWENIRTITSALQIDHIQFRPAWPVMQKIFSNAATEDIFPAPTLLRASAICTACISLVKTLVLKTALEMSIPLVAYGWSPGQAPLQSSIMKNNAALVRQNQSAIKTAFPDEARRTTDSYFIPDSYFELYKERFPHNIHPLAFFEYDEQAIMLHLNTLGWQAPRDTDTNSTNCLLNAFANQCHLDRHKFHPYVWEIANMVRQGIMNREEGIEKIYTDQNHEMVLYAKERLGL